ncbi:hypothetical protein [Dethiothermospora halolimnae]|uniref:hypothetical protein n=1 Tax=Dethiothermospora halolimnae TaxID=3114390 RepID=UPI003CCC0FB7
MEEKYFKDVSEEETYSKIYDEGPKNLWKQGRGTFITGFICVLIAVGILAGHIYFDGDEPVAAIFLTVLVGGFGLACIFNGIKKIKKASDIEKSDSEIYKAYDKLNQFKTMKITEEELDSYIDDSFAEYFYENPVTIDKSEVRSILLNVKDKTLTDINLFKWVDYIWFCEFYIFSEEVNSVLKELEEIYQSQQDLDEKEIEYFINKLQ